MSLNKRLMSSAPPPFVASENFKAIIYTGNGGNQGVTGVGFQPDMIWIKERNGADAPRLLDVARGVNSRLFPSENNGVSSISGTLNSFDTDGFTVGSAAEVNQSGQLYVAYCWKAGGGAIDIASSCTGVSSATSSVNKAAGFSIIKYATNAASVVLPHGLGVTPKLAIVKRTDDRSDWFWYQAALVSNKGRGFLNQVTAFDNSGVPTFSSTNITFASNDPFSSGSSGIVYTFADIAGYSKVGTYTGTDAPLAIETGFEPAFILIRSTVGQDNWRLYDTARGISAGFIEVNKDVVEDDSNQPNINILSNGFEITSGGVSVGNSADGNAYIYLALAADPDEVAPTLASSFNIETWAGNARDNTAILGIGFKPDMVWYKTRSASNDHNLSDSIRGATFQIRPDRDIAQVNGTDLVKSFDSDGFTLGTGGDANANGQTYVAWIWKGDDNEPAINTEGTMTSITRVHANAGFSIVQFTNSSPGGNARIGHGLSTTPNMIFVKRTDGAENWYVFHSGMIDSNGSPLNEFMRLDLANAQATATNLFNTVNATVFNPSFTSASNQKIMAYCFHDVTGYQKFGSYTGNGNAGQAITTGFKLDFVMIKSTHGTSNWTVYDTRRGVLNGGFLNPDNSDTETTGSNAPNITITSSGFTITSGGVSQGLNSDTRLYIYWAIAKNVPSNTTLADSFKIVTWSGNASARTISGMGFNPDLLWIKARNATEQHYFYDKLRGASKYLHTNLPAAEGTDTAARLRDFTADGFKLGTDAAINGNNNTYIAWGWKAGNNWQSNIDGTNESLVNANTANGFSVVQGTGTGGNNAVNTFGHGLGVKPDVIILKSRTSEDNWYVYHKSTGAGKRLDFNDKAAASTSAEIWANTEPTTSVFSIKNAQTFTAGATFIAYCWQSISGYSEFGSYTGNGSANNAITGVGFQPDWVMLKNVTDADTNWQIFDSERTEGHVITANATTVEADNSSNFGQFDSDGFTVQSNNDGNNKSGSTYIYMAFKEN